MKTTRLSTEIALGAICVFAWGHLLLGFFSSTSNYQQTLNTADTLYEQKLYEVSAEQYRAALRMQESRELYEKLLLALKNFYAEDLTNKSRKALLAGYSDAIDAFPSTLEWWEEYVQMYIDSGSYQNAVEVLNDAQEEGISSETLSQQWLIAYYAIRSGGGGFENISPVSVDGRFAVERSGLWGSAEDTGPEVITPTYPFAGPVGEGGRILFSDGEQECFLIGSSGTMVGRFDGVPAEAFGYGAGVTPIRFSDREDWSYVGYDGTEAFGGFQCAGRFQDGKAAVMSDGSWYLIDIGGNRVGGPWEEILLDETGAWLCGGRMLVKQGGVWYVSDTGGNLLGGLAADAVDAGRGSLIAFRKGGKWGYADTDGNVIIEPAFAGAKSFSGGIGAVYNGELWGFLNASGTLVVEYQYVDTGYFNSSGYCPVRTEESGNWRLIRWVVAR